MTAVFLAACFGACVGSFLNVVAWRIPRHQSVVMPPSACPRCAAHIGWRDNLPVLSWLLLRGRCRACGGAISWRYPAVEAGTALLWALIAWRIGGSWLLPPILIGASTLLVLAVIDIDMLRIPDRVLAPGLGATAILLVGGALATGDRASMTLAVLGSVVAFGALLMVHLVSPRGLGFGDVKLAALCGLLLGWFGWWPLVIGLYGAFVLGAVVGVVAIALRGRNRARHLPFAPYMAAATLATVLVFG